MIVWVSKMFDFSYPTLHYAFVQNNFEIYTLF